MEIFLAGGPLDRVITRTVLEALRADGVNWQAIGIGYSFNNEILAAGQLDLDADIGISYYDAITSIQMSREMNLKNTYFIIETESFFTKKGVIGGKFEGQDVIVHRLTLTPVQVFKSGTN